MLESQNPSFCWTTISGKVLCIFRQRTNGARYSYNFQLVRKHNWWKWLVIEWNKTPFHGSTVTDYACANRTTLCIFSQTETMHISVHLFNWPTWMIKNGYMWCTQQHDFIIVKHVSKAFAVVQFQGTCAAFTNSAAWIWDFSPNETPVVLVSHKLGCFSSCGKRHVFEATQSGWRSNISKCSPKDNCSYWFFSSTKSKQKSTHILHDFRTKISISHSLWRWRQTTLILCNLFVSFHLVLCVLQQL